LRRPELLDSSGGDSSGGLGQLGQPAARTGLTDSSAGLGRLGRPDTGSRPRPDAGGGAAPGGAAPGGASAPVTGRRRGGATRADLVRPGTAGATALQPRVVPEPDEVTDTGARRARRALRVADDLPPALDEDAYGEEPSLVLQWGIFLAQTLTGAAVGLGVWLGFYRLWATWPFYAAPAVGAALIGMLFVARTLRRRYGHELDLLTAAVTTGVGTVLTVLPAAFTLQGLA
jgi:hypothetical protein